MLRSRMPEFFLVTVAVLVGYWLITGRDAHVG